jgi:vacuolar protein sorting-associated protein 33A
MALSREEAVGLASHARWFDLASVCYDWLVRGGYINFGCLEIPSALNEMPLDLSTPRQRMIVVIGAGMSGLGCARQLEGLFKQYADAFRNRGEPQPRVVVLEGRGRVGGRVYSREFSTKLSRPAPSPQFKGRKCTAEMGGMIITGFERGNPMNVLVRAQLCLPYHALVSTTTIHDATGEDVDPIRDQLAERLYNDCLERVSEYKWKTQPAKLIEGSRDLMDEGKDSSSDGQKTISSLEEATAALPHALPVSQQNVTDSVNLVPVSSDKLTGRVHNQPGTPAALAAAHKAKMLGWTLKPNVGDGDNIDLTQVAVAPNSTLGLVLDEAVSQYQNLVDVTPQDLQLMNWHIANLEYSNATNLHNLSLPGWDIDAGNEWDGKHTMVVGGYQNVPRGLSACPTPLEIRTKAPVSKISYPADGSATPSIITLEDGSHIEADVVVSTIPLGVLKEGTVEFDPPLPPWKSDVIKRLGFGVLNKVILIYNERDVFWDTDRNIFGVLRDPADPLSLSQKDYSSQRGRLFQWFNVSNTSGLPCLIALMAGDAGFDTESAKTDDLVKEATGILRKVFGRRVPYPVEAIVTRWQSDRFARGSYSSAGPDMEFDDYDVMARPVGNLFFAGEHTTGTHPATVHGAYLSGLRAASEVVETMLGPIEVPTPLVLPREFIPQKRKAPEGPKDPAQARIEAYELEVLEHIHSKIGDRPVIPSRAASNAYIFYSKANFEIARQKCREKSKGAKAKSGPNEVRIMTAKMWKDAAPEEKAPYEAQAEEQKRAHVEAMRDYSEKSLKWDQEAIALRSAYEREHPGVSGPDEVATDGASVQKHRRVKHINYAEDDSDREGLL